MEERHPIYVLDTNVLVDYPDIIPGENAGKPKNPTIDLTGAHLVIPSAVIRELSSFKREKSDRGRTARRVLKRLRTLTRKKKSGKWWSAYRMKEPIRLDANGLTLSILPVHKNFKRSIPYSPSEEDMDGQIILTAISASYITHGLPNDGAYASPKSKVLKWAIRKLEVVSHRTEFDLVDENYYGRNVVILTNDNGLAIRAHERGIATDRFGYDCPAPYTGRRDLVVPNELYKKYFLDQKLSRVDFERMMPDQPPLVANEFIIMTPENPDECPYYNTRQRKKFANIGRYVCDEDALMPLKFVPSFPVKPLTVGQALYAEALADPSVAAVICTGPAGSGKTYMVTIYSYIATLAGLYMGISVVPCENTSKLGALPGGLNSKMDPQVQPFKNALRNYLYKKGYGQTKKVQPVKESDEDSGEQEEVATENQTKEASLGQTTKSEAQVAFEEAAQDSLCEVEVEAGDDFAEETTEEAKENTDSSEKSEQEASTSGRGKSARKRKPKHRTKETRNRHQKSLKVLLDDKVESIWRDFFSNIPIEVARGQDFNDQIAIYDEFQDQNTSQADTLIKRISGDHGKIVITGDIEQIHSPYLDENNNGIVYAAELLFDSPMVARVSFLENDVVRHQLVKMVAERQKKAKAQKEDT